MITIDVENQQGIINHVSNRLGIDFKHASGIGVLKDGEILASILFYDYHPESKRCEMAVASSGPEWATRRVLSFAFDYAFNKLDCDLIQTVVDEYPLKQSKRLREFNTRLGFSFDAKLRARLPNGHAAYVFSMMRDECKWLKEISDGEEIQHSHTAAAA